MTQSTDQDIREIKSAIEANVTAISDLAASITGLREEIKVGFTRSEGQINNAQTNLDAKIDVVRGEIKVIDVKSDRQTPVKFWSFLVRGIGILALGSLFIAFLLS